MLKNHIAATNSDKKSFNRYSQNDNELPSQFDEQSNWELESFKQYEHDLQTKYPQDNQKNNVILEDPYYQNDNIYQRPSEAIDISMQKGDMSLTQSVGTAQLRQSQNATSFNEYRNSFLTNLRKQQSSG